MRGEIEPRRGSRWDWLEARDPGPIDALKGSMGSRGGAGFGSSRRTRARDGIERNRGMRVSLALTRGDQRRRVMRANNDQRLVCYKLLRSLLKQTIMAYSWLFSARLSSLRLPPYDDIQGRKVSLSIYPSSI